MGLGEGGLVLPQLKVPGFVNSPWKALHFLRRLWSWVAGRRVKGKVEKGVELWLVCKMNENKIKIMSHQPGVSSPLHGSCCLIFTSENSTVKARAMFPMLILKAKHHCV